MSRRIEGNLFPINPNKLEWKRFVDMSCEYILNSWPELLTIQTAEEFKKEYEEKLKKKSLEETRGLFLFKLQDEVVGLANVYIDEENRLNIAEFYIIEEQRRKGLGGYFFNLLKEWGKLNNARLVRVEVDKHLKSANAFWKGRGLVLSSSDKRNVYTGIINA